jgi:hypothetical protein
MGQLLGGGDAMPTGYNGLSQDQLDLVNKVGYYLNPDAVAPNGGSFQQPQGYSNLNPGQIQAVNQLGYYTNPDAAKPGDSMLQTILSKLGTPGAKDALQGLAGAMGGNQQQRIAGPPTTGLLPSGQLNPYYDRQLHAPPQPREALQRLLRGY